MLTYRWNGRPCRWWWNWGSRLRHNIDVVSPRNRRSTRRRRAIFRAHSRSPQVVTRRDRWDRGWRFVFDLWTGEAPGRENDWWPGCWRHGRSPRDPSGGSSPSSSGGRGDIVSCWQWGPTRYHVRWRGFIHVFWLIPIT